jgi:CspA family cold shock protein
MSSSNEVVTPSERLIGRVKWFNNQAGYGFITITDGEKSGSDIFVHHSALEVESQQYKYLIQGEYVEFGLVKSSGGNHEWQASKVNGIRGGKMMCETRRDFKASRTTYKNIKELDENVSEPRQQSVPRQLLRTDTRQPRVRGEGPRDGEEKKEWTLVKPKAAAKPRGRPPRQISEAK